MIEQLKQLGLSHYESKVLEILLKEQLPIRELSKKSDVPFGKIYSIIKSLKQRNIVKETNSRPKLVYVENASEVISDLIKEKQEKEKLLLNNLRELTTEIDKERKRETRFFQIGITPEERREIQLRTWREAEEEVLQILNIHHNPKINRQGKRIYEKEIEKAIQRGIKFKYLFPENKELPKILKKLNKKYPEDFQVKKLNTDFPRCDIIDRRKVLIKLVHQDIANSGGSIFIEHEKLAENLVEIFSEFWEQAD